jgi:PAS domain S-box-containing protein
MADMLGYQPEEMIGRSIFDFMDQEDHVLAGSKFESRKQNIRETHEQRLIRKDGATIWVIPSAVPMKDKDGRFAGSLGLMTDITERKKMEDELRQSRTELELHVQERTNELSQTVRTLHERSEQLRRMTAELTLAEQRERQRLSAILHDGLQQILVGAKYRLAFVGRSQDVHRATDDVAELIDDAIETSRTLTAELSPPILLQGDLLSALEWLARWMHDKHEIDVHLTAREKIKPLTEELFLLLFQAARELLFNVVKHAGVRTASIEVNQRDEQILMRVVDEGSGFDPSQLRTKGGQTGGIGLFGISERVSYIGGCLEIDSAPGRGSRFTLTVPLSAVIAEPDRRPTEKQVQVSVAISPQLESKPTSGEKRIRIMLVDDHMVMRQGLAGLIGGEPDLEVVGQASDGKSAVNLVRDIQPDVVLMDIGMPGVDGIQATRIIRKEFPKIRVIGFSMFQEPEQEAAIRNAGAVDYLTKSGPAEAVIEAIRACVRVSEKVYP